MTPRRSEDPIAANRRLWDARTPIHVASDFYDVGGFRADALATSLRPLEIEDVGDVAGKRLLHLQCHFGLDTLSWARLGADVTGLDFSGEAVAAARRLAAELGIESARFVESDVYDAATALGGETFDVVFTSYGVLAWLPDIRRWAEVAAALVAPGGCFYIAEIHPACQVLDDEPGVEELRVGYPYWTPTGPLRFEESGTYADYEADIELPEYIWLHGLGDIVTSLIDAGLVLEFLHEHEQTVFQQLPFLERHDDGWWRLPASMPSLPLLFSLRASKPR